MNTLYKLLIKNLGWSGSVNIGLDKSKRYLETL